MNNNGKTNGEDYHFSLMVAIIAVLTLIGSQLEFKLLTSKIDPQGRFIILNCVIQGMEFLLINIYAPNYYSEQVEFFKNIEQELRHFDPELYTIFGGDFNCNEIDADGGAVKLKFQSILAIETIMETRGLIDIWRMRNPLRKIFTWRSPTPLIQRRLYYFFITDRLQHQIHKAAIIPGISSDHSVIILCFKSLSYYKHVPSHWKFNISLLEDTEYIEKFKLNYIKWKMKNSYHDQDNYIALWEFLKYNIRMHTIKYSKVKKCTFRTELNALEKEVKQLEQNLAYNSESNKELYLEKRQKINNMYDAIADGIIIIRSRVQWYEQGEKSTKYFLNLEKRQKIRALSGNF